MVLIYTEFSRNAATMFIEEKLLFCLGLYQNFISDSYATHAIWDTNTTQLYQCAFVFIAFTVILISKCLM